MAEFKQHKFKSKKDAYGTFASYFFAPYMIIGLGIYAALWYHDNGPLSYAQTKQAIFFVVFVGVLVLVYSWRKAFSAFFAIMKDDYDDAPETVACVSCEEPYLFEKIKAFKCPKCGGRLENLEGFYERHPELMNLEKMQKGVVHQQNRGAR